jgi:hypothetical protein
MWCDSLVEDASLWFRFSCFVTMVKQKRVGICVQVPLLDYSLVSPVCAARTALGDRVICKGREPEGHQIKGVSSKWDPSSLESLLPSCYNHAVVRYPMLLTAVGIITLTIPPGSLIYLCLIRATAIPMSLQFSPQCDRSKSEKPSAGLAVFHPFGTKPPPRLNKHLGRGP